MKSVKKILMAEITAAGVGAVVGGALGMLFAPRSGKQTRKLVAKEGKKATSAARKAVRTVGSQVAPAAKKAASPASRSRTTAKKK